MQKKLFDFDCDLEFYRIFSVMNLIEKIVDRRKNTGKELAKPVSDDCIIIDK